MSEETVVAEQPAVAETPATEAKPAGYHSVDVKTASPEEIQERMDYLYRQAKQNTRTQGELRKLEKIAEDQSKLISELSTGMGAVVDHLQGKQINESEAEVKRQMKTALDSGDTTAYVEAQDKLMDIKARKNTVQQQKPKSETKEMAYGGEKVGRADSENVPDLTQQDATYVKSWMEEKDDRGRTFRPWTNEADPEYEAAVAETKSVFMNPRFADKTIDEKLSEIDRRMGVAKQSGGQNVMGGNLTTRSKSNKVTLSPKQQEIAVKTRYGGKSAKSDADHIEAYRKQIEKVQATRGAR